MSEEPEIRNPRYAGATLGDVARGLFRPTREPIPVREGDGDAEEVGEKERKTQAR